MWNRIVWLSEPLGGGDITKVHYRVQVQGRTHLWSELFLTFSFQISLNLMKHKLEILHSDVGNLVNLPELKIEVNNLTRLPLVLNQMANLRSIICEDHLMETLDPQSAIWSMDSFGIYKRIGDKWTQWRSDSLNWKSTNYSSLGTEVFTEKLCEPLLNVIIFHRYLSVLRSLPNCVIARQWLFAVFSALKIFLFLSNW